MDHDIPERECGYREAGGVYLASPLAAIGHPIQEFLMDPPCPINPAELGITPIGAHIVVDPRTGKANIFDWVGSDYPTIPRYLAEAQKLGVSRHVQSTMDWSRLDRDSKLYLIHPRAVLVDPMPYWGAEIDWRRARTFFELFVPTAGDPVSEEQRQTMAQEQAILRCTQNVGREHCGRPVKGGHDTDSQGAMCCRYWWQDESPAATESGSVRLGSRARRYTLKCGASYVALTTPETVDRAYQPGIFAGFPIKVEVIRDRHGGSHAATIERIRQATDLQITEESF